MRSIHGALSACGEGVAGIRCVKRSRDGGIVKCVWLSSVTGYHKSLIWNNANRHLCTTEHFIQTKERTKYTFIDFFKL